MKIGTLFNIDIYISKILMIALTMGILFNYGSEIIIVFLVIVLHEIAHVIAAKMLNLKVYEIELLPFGGVVRVESFFELNPKDEIIISLSGPMFNIMIVFICISFEWIGFVLDMEGEFFIQLNLILAGFNLLPALPLDGGRILRAVLSREIGMKKATNLASNGGLLLALFLIMTGVYSLYYKIVNPTLFIMSIFLIYSAIKEKRVATYALLRDMSYKKGILYKQKALQIRELVVFSNVSISEVINKFTPNRYHLIHIIDEHMQSMGILSESEITKGLLDFGLNTPIIKLIK